MEQKQWKISRGMEWWRKVVFPVRRVWTGVASRLGIRKTGILNLQHDVRACQYEDVRVMWEMLQRNETDRSPVKGKNRSLWSFFGWARYLPIKLRGAGIQDTIHIDAANPFDQEIVFRLQGRFVDEMNVRVISASEFCQSPIRLNKR